MCVAGHVGDCRDRKLGRFVSGERPCNTVDLYLAPSELKCNTRLSDGLLQVDGQHQLVMPKVRASAGIRVLKIRIEE